MNKVKELLAKLKQSVLAAYASLLDFLGVNVPEEVKEPQGYAYSLTFESSGEPVVSDCCEEHEEPGHSEMDAYGHGLDDGNSLGLASAGLLHAYDEDFDGVEVSKPKRKALKKTSKKKLTKKKKPTKKKKK